MGGERVGSNIGAVLVHVLKIKLELKQHNGIGK